MKDYVVVLPGDENAWEQSSPERTRAVHAVHEEFVRLLGERGPVVTGGAELARSRTAWTVRRDGDRAVVTEGPCAESTEQLTGFYLVRTDDLDDLLEVVGMLADGNGAVEVRPSAGDADAP